MKEFVVYTVLRIVLFLASFGVVVGIMALAFDGRYNLFWAVILAFLISGPIWAHEAWGSYWNWDPKEVWAFITWVVYAAYLHARSTAGWKGRNAAILALVGLATLWFNFIGINFFSSSSQHSYAEGAGVERSVVLRVAAAPVDVAQEVRVVVGADHPRA